MLKLSFNFLVLGFVAFFLSDIEVLTLDPWSEFSRLWDGIISPDFSEFSNYKNAIINTLSFAFCGISISLVLALPLSFFFNFTVIRYFCSFIRSIHEIFWAFIFLHIVGLNPVCGILAIAIPYSGIFAKVFAEIYQESDKKPLQNIPNYFGSINKFLYGILPIIISDILFYTKYRLECAIRSSAILGFIGLPTLGFYLESAFREGYYSQASMLLYVFFGIIFVLKYILKPILIPFYILGSFGLLSFDINFSWDNIIRFFTYEILPWPMRSQGFYDQTYSIIFNPIEILIWAKEILLNEGIVGILNTVILTQMGLVATGLFTLLFSFLATRFFFGFIFTKMNHILLIVLRTTPEYVIAYILLQLWGPSMLPAVFAIFLHNGSILAFLISDNMDKIKIRFDKSLNRMNLYFYEILPRIFSQFLAFLFYRWEVIIRESAILGILGISTLGFYIDSAISDDQLDKAIFLILITAILNMSIDTFSQFIRGKYKVSTKIIYS